MKNHHGILRLSDGHLDENGVYTGHFSTSAPYGFIRAPGAASIFQLVFSIVCCNVGCNNGLLCIRSSYWLKY